MRCLICRDEAVYGDLCKECWLGLKCFQRNPKLLGRAVAYCSPGKHKQTLRPKKAVRQSRKLQKLVNDQQKDAHDRIIRFEHAVDKD